MTALLEYLDFDCSIRVSQSFIANVVPEKWVGNPLPMPGLKPGEIFQCFCMFLLFSDCSIRVSQSSFFLNVCFYFIYSQYFQKKGLYYDGNFIYRLIFKLFRQVGYTVGVTTNHFCNFQNHT